MKRSPCLTILCILLIAGLSCSLARCEPTPIAALDRKEPVDFEREVLPILRANCVSCHHPKKAEALLVLETPQSILKGGESGPAVVAKKSGESLLLKVAAHEEESFMPPADNTVGAKRLTGEQLGLIKLWIDQGAGGTVSAQRPVQWQPAKQQPILACAVTPDGQYGACSRGNQLYIYHLPSGAVAAKIENAHQDIVRSLAFDPAGDVLASGGFREVKLWRRPRLRKETDWKHDAPLTALAVSSDGKLVATGDESGKVRVWDVAKNEVTQTVPAHSAAVTGLAFSPDGATIYSASLDKSLKAWAAADGKALGKPVETAAAINAVTLVHNGEWLVTGSADGAARVYEIKTLREAAEAAPPLKEIKHHSSAITCLAAAPDQPKEFLSGGEDGRIYRCSAESGEQTRTWRHDAPLTSLAMHADGKRFATAGGGLVKLWNADNNEPTSEIKVDPRQTLELARLDALIAFSKSAIAVGNQDIKSYEGAERRIMTTAESVKKAEEELVKAMKTRDEKKEAAEKVKDDAKKLEAANKAVEDAETAITVAMSNIDRAKAVADRAVQTLAAEKDAVAARQKVLEQEEQQKKDAVARQADTKPGLRSVAFSADGTRLAVGTEEGVVHSFMAESGAYVETMAGGAGAIRTLSFARSHGRQTVDERAADPRSGERGYEETLIAASDKQAIVAGASSEWKLERTIGGAQQPAFADRVLALDFSPDGKQLVTGGGEASASGEVKLWNVADGALVKELAGAHSDTVFAVQFSPDGQRIATAGADRFIHIFTTGGERQRTLAGHTAHVLSVAWRGDGKQLVSTGTDRVLKQWDVETGVPIRTMKGTAYQIGSYKGEVTAARFIGASEQIIAASGDGTVRLHRSSSENEIMTYGGAKGYQYCVAATPDGQTLLAGGADGVLRLWRGQEREVKRTFAP